MQQEAEKGTRQTEAGQTAASATLADASAKFFADQASAMTMMAAFGLGLSAKMAGAFMGAMATALERDAAQKSAPAEAQVVPQAPVVAEPRKTRPAKVVPLRVVKKEHAPVADDLKRISGIGPRLEKVLNGMGIRTWADIARWTEADMREIDDKLGLDNRVLRDNWATQAKALLEG